MIAFALHQIHHQPKDGTRKGFLLVVVLTVNGSEVVVDPWSSDSPASDLVVVVVVTGEVVGVKSEPVM